MPYYLMNPTLLPTLSAQWLSASLNNPLGMALFVWYVVSWYLVSQCVGTIFPLYDLIRYTPSVSEVIKYAWIQYIAMFAVVSFLLFRLNSFVFRHKVSNFEKYCFHFSSNVLHCRFSMHMSTACCQSHICWYCIRKNGLESIIWKRTPAEAKYGCVCVVAIIVKFVSPRVLVCAARQDIGELSKSHAVLLLLLTVTWRNIERSSTSAAN